MQAREEPPYTLCQTQDAFYIRCLTTGPLFSSVLGSTSKQAIRQSQNNHLRICRLTNKIEELCPQQYQNKLEEVTLSHIIKFYLLMGSIVINQEPYLLLVVDAQQIASYVEHPIYMISDILFLPYRQQRFQKELDNEQQGKVMETLKNTYINEYFYFSYKEIITAALVSHQGKERTSMQEDIIRRGDNKQDQFNQFAWNRKIIEPFLKSQVHNCWTIPVFQGFVAQLSVRNKYFRWQYLNISRRSTYMSGTRFNSRGIDLEGHPANFVQTQQIVKIHNRLFVHVSVRGSVPIFWQQQKVRANINFIKEKQVDEKALMREHYATLERRYKSKIVTINLLSKDKNPQKDLRLRFEQMYSKNIERDYFHFDLNKVMEEEDGQQQISHFVNKHHNALFGDYPFSAFQNITLTPKFIQSVVPRINCLDCLDRTNVMMARISESFLIAVAEFINEEVDMKEKRLIIDQGVISKLIKVWAALGDKISRIYCGTGSVATHMTKKQNNTLLNTLGGAFTSFNRYLNASHSDAFKQKCIESLLGARGKHSETNYFNHNILNHVQEVKYCSFNPIAVSILTFDTDRSSPPSTGRIPIESFLTFMNETASDLAVLCLQEVDHVGKWSHNLQRSMAKRGYELLTQIQHEKADLFMLAFIRKSNYITEFKFLQLVEIPLKSNGALALFIEANDSVLCFINARFQGGFNSQLLRLDEFNQLHECLMKETYSSQLLRRAQAVFLAGNFNLRLSHQIQKHFKYKNTIEEIYVAEGNYREDSNLVKEALQYDELHTLKKSPYFNYKQGPIKFMPTYCYSGKKGGYDKSKPPAWCDRIFYFQPCYTYRKINRCPAIECSSYTRVDQRFSSSHKAVAANFKLTVRQENQKLKEELVEQYLFEKKEDK